jgi:hypothetical protein
MAAALMWCMQWGRPLRGGNRVCGRTRGMPCDGALHPWRPCRRMLWTAQRSGALPPLGRRHAPPPESCCSLSRQAVEDTVPGLK